MARLHVLSPDTPSRIRLPDGTERPVPEQMTLQEFMAFPWPEDQRWELIWGRPEMSPAPIPFHQDLAGELFHWMKSQLSGESEHKVFYEEDVLLSGQGSHIRPDIAVFPRNLLDMSKVPIRVLPLLIAEVLSPSTAARDWSEKKAAYAAAGVPEYWIVDPASCSLTIHVEPTGGSYAQQYTDAEGYLTSPFFKRRLRVRFDGQSYSVEDKPLP